MSHHPALAYAEVTLGVHQVYEEANALLEEIDSIGNSLVGVTTRRRNLDEMIEAREMDLVIEHRGHHPGMSEAAFTRHMKEVHHKDADLARLRAERAEASSTATAVEFNLKFVESKLKVKVARMEELGGYLHYLGAVKNAEVPPPLSPASL